MPEHWFSPIYSLSQGQASSTENKENSAECIKAKIKSMNAIESNGN